MTPSIRSYRYPLLMIGAALAITGLGLYSLLSPSSSDFDEALKQAEEALSRKEHQLAEQLLGGALQETQPPVKALLLAGKAAAGQGDPRRAVDYWDRIPEDCGAEGAEGLYLCGKLLLERFHQAGEAERRFRRAVHIDPDFVPAINELAHLLAVEGRTNEAVPFILDLFRHDVVIVDHLALLGMPLGTINDVELLRKCHLADRSDPGMLLGLASSPTFNLKPAQARLLLEEALRVAPEMIDGQARLGAILLKEGSAEEFLAWHRQLPSLADEHDAIWAIRGEYAQSLGQQEAAMRCFWEALRRNPNHRAALYQLEQMLLRAGKDDTAAPLIERGRQLQELRQLQDVLFHAEHTSLAPMRKVAEKHASLGRVWEAWGWCQMALKTNPGEEWAVAMRDRLASALSADPPVTLPASNPAAHLDLSHYPFPDWTPPSERTSKPERQAASDIAFVESARQLGLDFQYFNSPRPVSLGKRMYEFPGGGAAVLDYDADGWPDIYLTQGCRWPADPQQTEHVDRLFRNVGGEAFEEVAAHAGVIEPNFSHGVASGDFNHDGFPDLYVANIGRNRLFQNNGDGTYSDITASIADGASRWTTSCLMADLNGDGFPDLYDVNYLKGDDVFERVCQHADGSPRMCLPFHFAAEQDQIFFNSGDGRFTDATSVSGIEAPDGKGLGVVAADFDGSGRLSLFIANDTTPNFLFANHTAEPHSPKFIECGVARGVAYNAQGRAEGCMGVAVGDVNRDGRPLDLFIGNFIKETNTLYLQQEGGVFVDATSEFQLGQPSFEMLAFGAQFLDAEFDGDLDLVVTNGHVDDLRAYGRPYHMRPQVFENLGKGAFAEIPADALGKFFQGAYLGRALAKGDFDRDGLIDLVVSHLDSPAALLANRSTPRGGALVVRLCGVQSSRDAIGATVTIKIGDQTFVQQFTAGDGYQCSNQRHLAFGVGAAEVVDELIIRWPSGKTSTYQGIATGQEILCVEGAMKTVPVRNLQQ